MKWGSWLRQPPGGAAIPLGELWRVSLDRDPERALTEGLRARLGGAPVALHASGREALRVALRLLAKQSGRDEVLVPAYTCYSVPAAAVAAGLRVRLVDVTPEGRIDVDSLRAQPLERAAALVVTNLFGVPEPVHRLRESTRSAGVALVDDAAQAFGGACPDGRAGARGDLGILSFGRGKPLSGLGGGVLVGAPPGYEPARPRPRQGSALARALAYDAARLPFVFRWLEHIPALHVGETIYDPGFRRGPIDGTALCLAAAALRCFDEATRVRAQRATALATRIAADTRFVPIRPDPGSQGVFPRLALLAPDASARDAALASLRDLGASRLYPASLDALPALRPSLAGSPHCPGARELASRLLTVPTHRGLRGARVESLVTRLAGSA